ncbi:trigger factor [Escherichia coli]|nr:trigger factor [Escherichia coli]
MIPGFEDGIKGHKAGEEFTIDVTFPKNTTQKTER